MADHVITLASPLGGPAPDDSGFIFEDVQVVGTGGTTGTYLCQFVKQPQRLLGPFGYSFSGATATLTGPAFTGTQMARIFGYA